MNAVQCDYCGKFAANPDPRRYAVGDRGQLPKGWLFVATHPGGTPSSEPPGEYGEFCSRGCVSRHFAKPEAAE